MPNPATTNPEEDIDIGLEAAELSHLRTLYSHTQTTPTVSQRHSHDEPRHPPIPHWQNVLDPVRKFWSRQVSVTVPHEACRDHLALERTFLAYLRTSLAISALGVAVAQLFRIQHTPIPDLTFGFYVLGKPLACCCQVAAIYCLFLGTYRTWRLQNAIVRGKALSGGFELVLLGLGMVILTAVFLILIIAVDIDKDF